MRGPVHARALLILFGRYATIFREGNVGRSFYVLIKGAMHCTTLSNADDTVRAPLACPPLTPSPPTHLSPLRCE